MPRTICMACKGRPAIVLKTKRLHFAWAAKTGVFCSRGCAADWALMHVGTDDNIGRCFKCKEWTTNALDFDEEGRCWKCGKEEGDD